MVAEVFLRRPDQGADGDGFHKVPDVLLTFPQGLVKEGPFPFYPPLLYSERWDARSNLERQRSRDRKREDPSVTRNWSWRE